MTGEVPSVAAATAAETLAASSDPLPVGFLAAAAAVGDTACLEPLAASWIAATSDRWWRDHLAEAFTAIVRREKLTRRHPALKDLVSASVRVRSASGRTGWTCWSCRSPKHLLD